MITNALRNTAVSSYGPFGLNNEERMGVTTNKFRCVWSRLACFTADLVSKNDRFSAVFRKIVVKTQDDRRCVKWASAMRAVVLPWRLGYQMMANGCSKRHGPCLGDTRWSILR